MSIGMSSHKQRLYPPRLCSAKTMAYLLDMSESSFHDKVRRGLLPKGYAHEGLVRWDADEVTAAFIGQRSEDPRPKDLQAQADAEKQADIQAHVEKVRRRRMERSSRT